MKEKLRLEILAERNKLTPELVSSKSSAIIQQLISLDVYQKSKSVMVYLDFRNEVQTGALIQRMLREKKNVLIPVTNPSDHTLTISHLKNPEHDLMRSHFGLLEPKPEAMRLVDPSVIDLVLVPGLVFDSFGYRIGFGAGYYDRFLASLPADIPLLSMLYELQLVDQIPREPHDIPVHLLVTEKRIIHCQNQG